MITGTPALASALKVYLVTALDTALATVTNFPVNVTVKIGGCTAYTNTSVVFTVGVASSSNALTTACYGEMLTLRIQVSQSCLSALALMQVRTLQFVARGSSLLVVLRAQKTQPFVCVCISSERVVRSSAHLLRHLSL